MAYDTETLDKLYLELSQFTQAKTRRELELEAALASAASNMKTLIVERVREKAALWNKKYEVVDVQNFTDANRELMWFHKSEAALELATELEAILNQMIPSQKI